MSDRMTIKGPKAIEHGFVSKVRAPGNVREEITPGTALIIENTVMLMISMIFTSYERNTARYGARDVELKTNLNVMNKFLPF